MKPLFTVTKWPPLAVYDIEATEWVNVKLLCHVDELGNRVAFSGKTTVEALDAYLDWVYRYFKGDVLWAHAGGRYDHRFLIARALERGWEFKASMSGGTIVILTIDNGTREIKFGDSYRLMPNALREIGKTVGIEKIDVDRSHIEKLSPHELEEYCYRDCDIALKGLQLMRDTLTSVGADFAFTLASIATRWVRRSPVVDWKRMGRWEGRKYIMRHCDKNAKSPRWDELCFDAFFGGRCEMYRGGVQKDPHTGRVYIPVFGTSPNVTHKTPPIIDLDVVSSYPASMREELPLYYMGFHGGPRKGESLEAFLGYCGTTECEVYVPMPKSRIAVLCQKAPNGRLQFPWGHMRGTWTNIELLAAIEQGAVIGHIYGQSRFEAKPFLRGFVDTFYALRKRAKANHDAFQTYAYKILLNSLYGKLTETVHRKTFLTRGECALAIERGASIETTPTQGVFAAVSEEPGPFRHSAAGAYVTAYSRLRLFRGLQAVSQYGKAYYCDTDSIMTDAPLDKICSALTIGKELGDWNHEATFTELEIVLPKVYRAVTTEGEVIYRCKGNPIEREDDKEWGRHSFELTKARWHAYNLPEEATPDEMEVLEKDGITGFTTDINRGSLYPKREPRTRVRHSSDKKREWDGVDSLPIAVGELE